MRPRPIIDALRRALPLLVPAVACADEGESLVSTPGLEGLVLGVAVLGSGLLVSPVVRARARTVWHRFFPPPAPPTGSPDDPVLARHPADLEWKVATFGCSRCGGRCHPPGDPVEELVYRRRRLSVHVMACRRCGGERRVYAIAG